MPEDIDTMNKFMVAVRGEQVLLLRPPLAPMTKADALNLAAWLVAIADDEDTFDAVLAAVKNT